ncbi:MAG: UvrB/UvrC motif-containing protein [Peptococcaceae bacterium]|nr:UvrB/UvrC motif-containing protein [Peptococcaceae bacterium]
MYCELCKKNPATIHYTKIVNVYKEERHLCEQCANSLKEPGGGFPTLGLMPDFSMADFIGGFFNPESQSQPFVQKNMTAHDACPMCGMTAGEFRRVGRVGCSNCYSYFAEYMPGLIQRIHGNSRHTGKVPVRGEAKLAEKQKIVQLRQALQQAISEEQFERAAELRDEIRRLEQEGGHNA